MKIKTIISVLIAAAVLCGCGRKSKLTVDTFFLTIEPGASWVEPLGSVELSISAHTATRSGIAVNARWFLQTSGMGTLSSDYGEKTVFTAKASECGTATVAAFYNNVIKTVDIGVGVKSILSDYHLAGNFFVFPDGIAASKFITADSREEFREGVRSTKATYNFSTGEWAGFSITPVSGSADMSKYSAGKVLFWIKTTVNLEIKIAGIIRKLDAIGQYKDNNWHELEIDLSTLGIADFANINEFFVVAVKSEDNANAPIQGSFYVDDVRWTMN